MAVLSGLERHPFGHIYPAGLHHPDFAGLFVSKRTAEKPKDFNMSDPNRKSRSSSSKPSRWLASTVSNP